MKNRISPIVAENEKKILDALAAASVEMRASGIANKAGITESRVHNYISSLVVQGKIIQKKRGQTHFYSLPL